MKVAYIGNQRHPWCTEVHVAREIEALGHEVWRIQEPPGGADERWVAQMQSRLLRNDVDVVLFTRTWGLPQSATAMWRTLEERGIVTASFHLDLYRGLVRESSIEDDPFWTTQFVFTPDGDPVSAEWFAEHGVNHHWSPPAVVSDECVPGRYRKGYDYDVVFVGSRGYHPEWPWRVELLDWLERTYGPRFRRFSGDDPGGPTRGQDLNDLYASAQVVVGDSLCLLGHTLYWSDRFYETVGRGGFLIGPRVPGIEDHFTDGEHLVLYDYGDFSGLRASIDHHLANPEKARWIAANGQVHVREHHTYKDRLAAVFETMGLG